MMSAVRFRGQPMKTGLGFEAQGSIQASLLCHESDFQVHQLWEPREDSTEGGESEESG